MTLEEGTGIGGFGAAVLEASAADGLGLGDRLLLRAVPDRFISHGSRGRLLEEAELSPAQIVQAITDRLGAV